MFLFILFFCPWKHETPLQISEIYPYCPKLRRRPKLQNSCSLMWHIVEQLYKELGNWCGTIIERHSQKCKPWAKPPNNRSNGFIIAPIELRTGFPNCSMYAEEQNCCILRRLQWSHSEQIVIILFNFFNNCLEIWRPILLNSQSMFWKSNFILGKPKFFGHGSKGEIQHIVKSSFSFSPKSVPKMKLIGFLKHRFGIQNWHFLNEL